MNLCGGQATGRVRPLTAGEVGQADQDLQLAEPVPGLELGQVDAVQLAVVGTEGDLVGHAGRHRLGGRLQHVGEARLVEGRLLERGLVERRLLEGGVLERRLVERGVLEPVRRGRTAAHPGRHRPARGRRDGDLGGHAGDLGRPFGAAHRLGDLGQEVGQFDVERLADRGEQLGRCFLLPALDLGQVTQADPGRTRHFAEGTSLTQPAAAQRVPEHAAEQGHRRAPPVVVVRVVTVPLCRGHGPAATLDTPEAKRRNHGRNSGERARNAASSRSRAARTASARTAARSPVSASRRTWPPPGPATPTNTVPTAVAPCGSGPATPVLLRPYVAASRSRAPAASAAATSGLTGPWASSSGAGTPASCAFRSVAYTTRPPRTAALAPAGPVSAAVSRPPVSDSATATVTPAATSAASTARARSSGEPAPTEPSGPAD